MSCNPNILVTKQFIDSGKLYHRTIINSKIPNPHISGENWNVEGLQVGNYFWILGSESDGEDNIQKLNGNSQKIAYNWLLNFSQSHGR